MVKSWPKDGSPADFEDLTKPLVKAVKFAYKLRRKNLYQDIPYDGYERSHLLGTCPPAEEGLSTEGLKYSSEHGRSALDEVIALSVQLGIEQGKRLLLKQDTSIRMSKVIAKTCTCGAGRHILSLLGKD